MGAADEELGDRRLASAGEEDGAQRAAEVAPLHGDRVEVDGAEGDAPRREVFAQRPAELAPFEGEEDDGLVGIGDGRLEPGDGLRVRLHRRRRGRGRPRGAADAVAVGGGGDLLLLPGHLLGDVGEKRRREIALAGVGRHEEDRAPLRHFLGHGAGGGVGGAAGEAAEDALAPGEVAGALQRAGAAHPDDLVDVAGVESSLRQLRDEIGRPALHEMGAEHRVRPGGAAVGGARLGDAAGEDRGVVGLAGDHPDLRPLGLQDAGDAVQRAAGAGAGDEGVKAPACEGREDLAGGGAGVGLGVGLVLELASEEPAVSLGELAGLGRHAGAFLGGRGQDDAGAEEAHQPAALDAEALGHDDDEGVAPDRADHGEADAGIAARRLDDSLAGAERAVALGRLDDREGEAVLDRAHRVERFELGVERGVGGCERVQADDGRVANRGEDVLMKGGHGSLLGFVPGPDRGFRAAGPGRGRRRG